jgi:4-hydroxy-tetrahydrodipicolinate reductase
MINTIINGCNGIMGRTLITTIASKEGFKVVAGVDPYGEAPSDWGFPSYKSLSEVQEQADVLIDFSRANGIIELLSIAKTKKLPVVIATTGLTEEHINYIKKCSIKIPVLQAANMSLGINLLKVLVKQTAAVLNNTFDIEIIEKHHNVKRDSPSGTALALADTLKSSIDRPIEFIYGRREKNKLRESREIGIHAIRGGNIVGEHDVIFAGMDERLTLSHAAYSKGLFAIGAIQAAEYLYGKPPGFYLMDNVIAEKSIITNLYTSEEALVSFKSIPASLGTSHNIFKAFSDADIIVDMISQTATDSGFHSLSFTIGNIDLEKAHILLSDMKKSNSGLEGSLFGNLCKITVHGIGMETQSGVATDVFGILDELGVEAKSVTTSETKISFIIDKQFREKVTLLVKERYNL